MSNGPEVFGIFGIGNNIDIIIVHTSMTKKHDMIQIEIVDDVIANNMKCIANII